MKRKKLLKALGELLDVEGRKRRRHQAELRALLKELEKKEAQLEKKVLREKDERKKKRLAKELAIVKAQYAKGVETMQTLEAS